MNDFQSPTSDSPIPPGIGGNDDSLVIENCPTCGVEVDVTELEPLSYAICPACRGQFLIGEWIDQYQLLSVAGRGGMGVVYKALDTSLHRQVALKVLRKDRLSEEAVAQLDTEAAITASISHPHVVKVYTTGTDRGRFYIAMELVDKGTLDDLIRVQGAVAEVQALEIAIQVSQGLRAASQIGMIHRDVKPGNILFSDSHTAKVVDFGLAMFVQAAAEAAGSEIWGTPYYVAPEKLDRQPEDLRSDIYSLGASLFHALAGRPPFEAEDASMVALKHLKNQAVSLQAFAPRVSGSTAYVINRMLHKSPDERYQTYDELIQHLDYAREELEKKAAKPAEKKRLVLETEEDQKIWSYLTFAMIALCGILVGGFLYYSKKPKSDEPKGAPIHRPVESQETIASAPPEPAVQAQNAEPSKHSAPVAPPVGTTTIYETETLKIVASSGVHRIFDGPGFSNGTGTLLEAKQVGDYVTYNVPGVASGNYEVRVGVKMAPERGIWQLNCGKDGEFATTQKAIGTPQDEYAAADAYMEIDLGVWNPATSTDKLFQFKVTGKNPKSHSYAIAFDYIKLTRK